MAFDGRHCFQIKPAGDDARICRQWRRCFLLCYPRVCDVLLRRDAIGHVPHRGESALHRGGRSTWRTCAIYAPTQNVWIVVRHHRQIKHGDVLTDMCIAVLFYPLALVQHDFGLARIRTTPTCSLPGTKESEEKEA